MKFGAVNGRFQPLHNEHLRYLLEAKKHCEFLWVGLTQINRSLLVDEDEHARNMVSQNPLTYFERVQMVRAALLEAGLTIDQFACIPFPIETPDALRNFLPVTIPVFTTVREEWNLIKNDILATLGYTVHVLYSNNEKSICSSRVRDLAKVGDASWKLLVPQAVSGYLDFINFEGRLQDA